jgi:hypothetical protein
MVVWKVGTLPHPFVSEDLAASIFRVHMETARSSGKLVSYLITTRCHNPEESDLE